MSTIYDIFIQNTYMYIHVFVLIVDIEVHLMCLICLYKYGNTAFTIGESSQ